MKHSFLQTESKDQLLPFKQVGDIKSLVVPFGATTWQKI